MENNRSGRSRERLIYRERQSSDVDVPDMRRRTYFLILAAVVGAVVFLRADLFIEAFRTMVSSLGRGPYVRMRVLGEVLLFLGIMILAFRAILSRVNPVSDLAIILVASLCGFLAEAWGTRAGLWTYYTRESPPLWIVPAWPIGALVIERVSSRTKELLGRYFGGRGYKLVYWLIATVFFIVFLFFLGERIKLPSSLISLAFVSAVLLAGRDYERDCSILLTGLVCVFIADFWGTTNGCWIYHTGHGIGGILGTSTSEDLSCGILFGMFFDSVVVLGCLRARDTIIWTIWRPRFEPSSRRDEGA